MKDGGILDHNSKHHYVVYKKSNRDEIGHWLIEYEGRGVFFIGGHGIYFSDSEDAMMFKLKWA